MPARRALLAWVLILLAAASLHAADAPKGASKAARQEAARVALLRGYRRQESYHHVYMTTPAKDAQGESVRTLMTLLMDGERAIIHVTSSRESEASKIVVLTPERFCMVTTGDSTNRMIARGLKFHRARTRRVNAALTAWNAKSKSNVKALPRWMPRLDLGMERDAEGGPQVDFGLAIGHVDDTVPSWLKPDVWRGGTYSEPGGNRIIMTNKGRSIVIDRAAGLLIADRLVDAQGKTTYGIERAKKVEMELALRDAQARLEKEAVNERGRSADHAVRTLEFLNLISHAMCDEALASARTPTAEQARARLLEALFGEALAKEELAGLISWGRGCLTGPGKPTVGSVLRDLQDRLLQRWWGSMEKALRPRADAPKAQKGEVKKRVALIAAWRDAVRTYAYKRIQQAWVD